ncbi:MAG: alpha-(1-2)-phosphatidylinositol mannosyltransferase, partial [Actinomycetes bacterium]
MTGRTLVITNDFPPRAGGIQSFVYGLVIRQPTDSVVVYCPKWRGCGEFDAKQPFPVVRHRNSLMLPTPGVLRTARRTIERFGCDRVLYGATAPLGLLAASLGRSGVERQVGITHGHEAAWSDIAGVSRLIHRIGEHTDTITYLGQYTRERIAGALSPQAAGRMRQLVPGVD